MLMAIYLVACPDARMPNAMRLPPALPKMVETSLRGRQYHGGEGIGVLEMSGVYCFLLANIIEEGAVFQLSAALGSQWV